MVLPHSSITISPGQRSGSSFRRSHPSCDCRFPAAGLNASRGCGLDSALWGNRSPFRHAPCGGWVHRLGLQGALRRHVTPLGAWPQWASGAVARFKVQKSRALFEVAFPTSPLRSPFGSLFSGGPSHSDAPPGPSTVDPRNCRGSQQALY